MDRIRTTISLDPEVYEVFRQMAETAGVSVSRCMGDWLADTVEVAQLATQKLVSIRRSPERAMAEFTAAVAEQAVRYQRGEPIRFDQEQLREELRRVGALPAREDSAEPNLGGRKGASAPSSLTGLNSPKPKGGRK